MARKPTNTATDTSTEMAPEVVYAMESAQQTASALNDAHTNERDLINQMMGQIQMTNAISKLTTVVGLTKLAQIKESKAYRALAGKKGIDRDGAEIADVGTWEGFCRVIGSTRPKVDEDILNLKSFGEEALSDLSNVGAGYRELRQLRKLPDDEKSNLIEAAKSGDKDSFLDLAEEIISKHAKEKELLTERAVEAEESLDDKERVLNEKNQQIDEMAVKLQRIRKMPKNEVTDELRKECSRYADDIEELMRHQMRKAFETISDYVTLHEELEPEFRDFMAARLDLLDDALLFLRAQVGIERTAELTNQPAWAEDDGE